MVVYVTHFTMGSPYEQEALELQESAQAYGVEVIVLPTTHQGSWCQNAAMKAEVIERFHADGMPPIVWLDADARIRKVPGYFDGLDCDFAAHTRAGRELLSGTLYFGNTAKSLELVKKWREINRAHPTRWDQKNLDSALLQLKMPVHELPASYCQIFDIMRNEGEPVIEHMQASRRHRRVMNARR